MDNTAVIPINHRFGRTFGVDSNKDLGTELLKIINRQETDFYRTFQFFLSSGDNSVPIPKLSKNEELEKEIKTRDMTIHFHASLKRFLCSNSKGVEIGSRKYLVECVKAFKDLPIDIVIHSGIKEKELQKSSIVESLNEIQQKTWSIKTRAQRPILVENSSGYSPKNEKSFNSVEDFRSIFEGLDITYRFGICIDTCHFYAAGQSELNSWDSTVETMEEINAICPIKLFHLNDSKTEFGSNKDLHRLPGKGKIWKEKSKQQGLKAVVSFAREKKIDVVTEANHNIDSVEKEQSFLSTSTDL